MGRGGPPPLVITHHLFHPHPSNTNHTKTSQGEELTVTYANLLLPPRDRQALLLESKHFLCHCPRCLTPPPIDALLGGVCCAKCGEKGLLLSPAEAKAAAEALREQMAGLGIEEDESDKKKGKEVEDDDDDDKWRCRACNAGFAAKAVASYLDTVEAAKHQVR